jgi:cyanate permease
LGVIRGSFQPVQLVLNAFGSFLIGLWVDQAGSYDAPFVVAPYCSPP